jgi:hypothetical protein
MKKSPPEEKWIILEINPHYLYYNMGIPILANVIPPQSQSQKSQSNRTQEGKAPVIKCLQIFGGLSTNPITISKLITNIYPVNRLTSTSTLGGGDGDDDIDDDIGKFISIGTGTGTGTGRTSVLLADQPQPQQPTATATGNNNNDNEKKNEKQKKKKKKKRFRGFFRRIK